MARKYLFFIISLQENIHLVTQSLVESQRTAMCNTAATEKNLQVKTTFKLILCRTHFLTCRGLAA
jgi:hypothetical protein